MSRALALSLLGCLLAACAFAAVATARRDTAPSHSCVAPCTVELGKALEDEYGENYTWPTADRSVLEVWTRGDGPVPADR